MSQAFRNRRYNGSATPNDIGTRNALVDTSTQDNAPLQSGTNDRQMATTVQAYPVQTELQHVNAEGHLPERALVGVGSIKDMIDYEVGGSRGIVDYQTYSTGVVSSDLMENFALTGEQAIIRRGRNPSAVGPVATADHNTLLSLAYAQATSQFYPNERSQADLIRSV